MWIVLSTSYINKNRIAEVFAIFCIVCQDAVPHMPKGSSIIFISSIAGFLPQPSMGLYGVTKTALLGLTKVSTWVLTIYLCLVKITCLFLLFMIQALALEMAPDIRVNCVAPGFVPTHFTKSITSDEVIGKHISKSPLYVVLYFVIFLQAGLELELYFAEESSCKDDFTQQAWNHRRHGCCYCLLGWRHAL